MLSSTNFLSEMSNFGISLLTIWKLNYLLSHFTQQHSSGSHPYSGISIQRQMPGDWSKFCLFFCVLFVVCSFAHTKTFLTFVVVVVVVDPTPPTCCQQSPAPEIMWQPAVSPPRWQGKAPLCRDSSRGPG